MVARSETERNRNLRKIYEINVTCALERTYTIRNFEILLFRLKNIYASIYLGWRVVDHSGTNRIRNFSFCRHHFKLSALLPGVQPENIKLASKIMNQMLKGRDFCKEIRLNTCQFRNLVNSYCENSKILYNKWLRIYRL